MLAIITSLIFCVAIPFIFMAMLTRFLDKSAPHYLNYRGNQVYSGLGIVWFIWLLLFWAGAHLLAVVGIAQPNWISYLVPIFPLISGTCVFGLFEDWLGNQPAKDARAQAGSFSSDGFTLGSIKTIAIFLIAFFILISLYWDGGSAACLTRVGVGACAVALSANLISIFDMKPGRVGKIYFVGLLLSLLCVAFGGLITLEWPDITALALAGFGPLMAVWRFDIGEKGTIGSAGASSMGAFLGFIIATSLPLLLLVVWASILLVLNIIGKRFSFNKLIEDNRILRKLDDIGRKDIVE